MQRETTSSPGLRTAETRVSETNDEARHAVPEPRGDQRLGDGNSLGIGADKVAGSG
jgi:hypothetical protein